MSTYADAEYESWEWQIPFVINGLPGRWRRSPQHRYDYESGGAKNNCSCPVCGSVGWVWAGWFSCDGTKEPEHVALIASGDVFIRARDA